MDNEDKRLLKEVVIKLVVGILFCSFLFWLFSKNLSEEKHNKGAIIMKILKIPNEQELRPYCDDQECFEIAELLTQKFHGLKRQDGFYFSDNQGKDHSWNVAFDGTIIDVTHQQFDRTRPVLIVQPGTEEYKRYYPWSLHHNPNCLHKLLNTGQECSLCEEET